MRPLALGLLLRGMRRFPDLQKAALDELARDAPVHRGAATDDAATGVSRTRSDEATNDTMAQSFSAVAQPGPANRATDHGEAATLAWTIAADLVAFLCVTHLGILGCFALAARVPNWLAPAALLVAVGLGDLPRSDRTDERGSRISRRGSRLHSPGARRVRPSLT